MLWKFPVATGVAWLFMYDSSLATYKWVFVGGAPVYAEVETVETTASAVYVALATAGPSIALTRAGVYDVEVGDHATSTVATAINYMSYDIGGTGAVDADAAMPHNDVAAMMATGYRSRRKTIASASTTLTAKYKTNGGTASFQKRWMKVTPVQII